MIENGPVVPAHFTLCRNEGGGLGAARGLAYIAHVVDMKVGEYAGLPRPVRRSASVA